MQQKQTHWVLFFITTAVTLLVGCQKPYGLAQMQALYGPESVTFDQRRIEVDLNGDQLPEQVIFLFEQGQELDIPGSNDNYNSAVRCNGLLMYDGRSPGLPVAYYYTGPHGWWFRIASDGSSEHPAILAELPNYATPIDINSFSNSSFVLYWEPVFGAEETYVWSSKLTTEQGRHGQDKRIVGEQIMPLVYVNPYE